MERLPDPVASLVLTAKFPGFEKMRKENPLRYLSGNTAAWFLTLPVLCILAVPAQSQTPRTILDGVYSEAQTTRGKGLYTAVCSGCHGNALEGISAPELTGNRFIERWREGTMDGIYNFIRERMPLGRVANANPIPDGDYLDILTYILKVNGYRSGQGDLTPGVLGNVMFVAKNGPQPVPDGALVLTVGCLSQTNDGVWILVSATEPVRTRTETTSPTAELKTSSQMKLGNLVFRLADLEAVPDFVPEPHKGHKMQAKGYLVRQPNAERISLSSMEMLDSACTP